MPPELSENQEQHFVTKVELFFIILGVFALLLLGGFVYINEREEEPVPVEAPLSNEERVQIMEELNDSFQGERLPVETKRSLLSE